jgi:crossover junction endodeoxyribonuclease RusA
MAVPLIIVVLPYPPSANSMWRHVGKRVLRSAEYEAWRKQCALIIRSETRGHGVAGPYAMTMQVGRPDRRRRDIDNLVKPVGDVLVLAGAVDDDCDCQKIEASWSADVTGVRVLIMETKFIGVVSKAAA